MRETGKKSLLLFAGINGAGKTSLYDTIKSRTDLGVRVSLDEIAKSMGDWKDPAVQVRAGCEALLQVRELIKEGKTFNQETTLPGMVMVSQLSDAKKAGYTIVLYFVGVQGVEIAINRVKKRIERGGHGISEEVIRKRYVICRRPFQKSSLFATGHFSMTIPNGSARLPISKIIILPTLTPICRIGSTM